MILEEKDTEKCIVRKICMVYKFSESANVCEFRYEI